MKKKLRIAVFAGILAVLCVVGSLTALAAPAQAETAVKTDESAILSVETALTTESGNDSNIILRLTFKNASFDTDATEVAVNLQKGEGLSLPEKDLQIGMVAAANSVTVVVDLPDTVALSYPAGEAPALDLSVTYRKASADGLLFPNDETMYGFDQADVLNPEINTPMDVVKNFLKDTGFTALFGKLGDGVKGESDSAFENFVANYGSLIMLIISFVLMYLAIAKGFEPLLLLPIAFGMLLTNLPGAGMFHEVLFAGGHVHWDLFGSTAGLLDYLYLGVKLGIYPCLIFMGVGAMTDFGPLIANPKSLLLGAAAQFGIFATYIGATLMGFTSQQASSIGIIGGADGPTAIFVTSRLAPELLGPIAVAAYSYMALVPVIQPPIMKLLTTKKERAIVMKPLRAVSKKEKIIFPILVTVFVALLVPSAAPLIGCLMLGNLFKECGVADRLSKTAQNELMNIVTIFLGTTVGATATASTFLSLKTIKIMVMGVCAFALGTAAGVILAKIMNLFTRKNKINPLIGSAGVSAVPMAARVSQMVGQKENPKNFLLMHAMGPNVAGVIGSAIAAGVLLALFG